MQESYVLRKVEQMCFKRKEDIYFTFDLNILEEYRERQQEKTK